MKRELKLNFGELRLVEERVAEFEGALADIDAAAAYFDDVLGEQESEAVDALMERYREMEEKIRYFQDILSQLKTLLGNYISDMESHIMPKDENAIMLVDRNDIWWNMKQIEANINIAGNLAAGRELRYYRNIDTTPSPPHIYEGMSPEAESAAWERYRQNLRESQNRKANYNKLRNFCDGMAGDTRNRLEEIYDRLEELYKKHVVEFENTDDDYKREAGEVYDACTDDKERIWDAVVKTAEFLNDIEEGAEAAVVDFISGILGLAVMLAKIDLALRVAAVTVPFGTTPQWVKDTGKEAVEGALGIAQILKNPGRALAAIGQKATDVVEEKGIPYALSYTVTDIAIGRLVDMGVGKLKSLAMGDEFADAAKILDNLDEAADAVEVADDIKNAAKVVEQIADAGEIVDKFDEVADVVKVADDLGDATKTMEKIKDIEDAAKVADDFGDAAKIKFLSSEEAEELAFNAIKGPDKADSIVLGKFESLKDEIGDEILDAAGKKIPSENSYNAIAKNMDAQYFELDKWDELSRVYSYDDMWKINEKFLDIQIGSGRDIYLTSDPTTFIEIPSAYSKELKYLKEHGYRFVKEGSLWHAIQY